MRRRRGRRRTPAGSARRRRRGTASAGAGGGPPPAAPGGGGPRRTPAARGRARGVETSHGARDPMRDSSGQSMDPLEAISRAQATNLVRKNGNEVELELAPALQPTDIERVADEAGAPLSRELRMLLERTAGI